MFKLVSEPTFRHKVRVPVPVNGGHSDQTMEATFRVLPPEMVEGFDLTRGESSTEFLRTAIVELHDIADDAGQPLTWCDEVLDQVLRLPYARIALARAYFEAVTKAKSGN